MSRPTYPRSALVLGLALLVGSVAEAAPKARAGRAFLAYPGESIQLDGRDSEGQDLEFRWVQIGGPTVALLDGASAQPRFTLDEPGRYSFELVVREGELASEPAVVDVIAIDADVAGRFSDAGCAARRGPPGLGLAAAAALGLLLGRRRRS